MFHVYLIHEAIEWARVEGKEKKKMEWMFATNEKEQIKAFLEWQLYSMYNLYAD